MCYRMINKSSDTAQTVSESDHMASGRTETKVPDQGATTARKQPTEPVSTGFMGHIQRWVKKNERKEEESVY